MVANKTYNCPISTHQNCFCFEAVCENCGKKELSWKGMWEGIENELFLCSDQCSQEF